MSALRARDVGPVQRDAPKKSIVGMIDAMDAFSGREFIQAKSYGLLVFHAQLLVHMIRNRRFVRRK